MMHALTPKANCFKRLKRRMRCVSPLVNQQTQCSYEVEQTVQTNHYVLLRCA